MSQESIVVSEEDTKQPSMTPEDVTESSEADVVNPFKVRMSATFSYSKLIEQFGSQEITPELLERFERVTGTKAHIFLKRGIFFSHRDLDHILDVYESGKQIFLYTGRGPSSEALHLGHMIPFMFTKYLQEAFKAILVVQMSDDEKAYFKEGLTLEEANRLSYANALDVIACGFDPERTYIFSNYECAGDFYKTVASINQITRLNTIKHIFGFSDEANMGMIGWSSQQEAPAFSTAFPFIFGEENVECLVPMAIDQDPYFRHCRDVAPRLGKPKPAEIHAKFLPSMNGIGGKMSATSDEIVPVYMTDDKQSIFDKCKKAFSGGRDSAKEHRQLGGDPSIDVPCIYMHYFMEDDEKLEDVVTKFKNGKYLSSDVKKIMAETIWNFVSEHQERRRKITSEDVKFFFRKRFLKSRSQEMDKIRLQNPTIRRLLMIELFKERVMSGEFDERQ